MSEFSRIEWMIMLDKTNQGGVLHMEREATGPIAVQIPINQR
jgi:hypothetical protein